jgi:hypothetical protein
MNKKMEWKEAIKKRVGNKKFPTLKRIRVGKILAVYASLPLFSAWAYLIAIPLMLPISPTLWAKDKIRWVKEWRSLR